MDREINIPQYTLIEKLILGEKKDFMYIATFFTFKKSFKLIM